MAASKKVSRKDIAKMSFRDFMRAAREPYRRLFSYLRPYRGRFALAEVARAEGDELRLVTPPLAEAARRAVQAGLTTAGEVSRVLGTAR